MFIIKIRVKSFLKTVRTITINVTSNKSFPVAILITIQEHIV